MEKMNNYSTVQNLCYIIKNTLKWKKSLVVMWVMHIFIGGISVFMLPYLIKVIISQIENKVDYRVFFVFIGVYTILASALYLLNGYFENQEGWKTDYIRIKFTEKILFKSLTIDYQKLENPQALDEQQKAMNAVKDQMKGIPGMMKGILKVGTLAVQTIAAASIVFKLNPILVVVLLALILVQFVPVDRTKKRDKREVWDELSPFWRKLFNLNRLTRHYEYAKDIRIYDMSDWIYNKQLDVNKEVQQYVNHSRDIWVRCHAIIHFFKLLQEAILYAYLVYSVICRGLLISDFTFYVAAVASFSSSVGDLLWEYAGVRGQSIEINDYRNFVEMTEKQDDDIISLKEFLRRKCVEGNCEFTFDNVSFCYEGQEKYALEHINLKIEAGNSLAIVGINGAGKTTLIKLLCRLYEPTSGRILLYDTDIRRFDKSEYFKIFSPVFQNVELYAFPLAENVSMKEPEKTNFDKVEDCVKRADLQKKVRELPNGIHTELLKVLNADGVELSGGEKQKLALARALYKDAPVVLLDEPTAAMDAIAENKLYSSFQQLVKGKTSIYISHRLSSTRFCDKVVMFENGSLVESGTHDELMEKEGKYAELFDVQAQYYKEGGQM